MMKTLDLRSRETNLDSFDGIIPRAEIDVTATIPVVTELINEVKNEGLTALTRHAERFDRTTPKFFRVPTAKLEQAAESLEPALKSAIEESISRVRQASVNQVPPQTVTSFPGGTVTQRWEPIVRAGVYVPGGKAVYPSSVIMNVVSAQAAGVKEIVVATPPQADFSGNAHPTVLATAHLLGIDRVYLMGGASAIGAMAFGVEGTDLLPVDVITGPGNVFVASAKRVVSHAVKIDSEAGPTEILIIADEEADAGIVASDLLSQAEHDELAAAVLVTTSESLVERVQEALKNQTDVTPNRTRAEAALSGEQSLIILVDAIEDAVAISNQYAPEHLSIQTRNPESLVSQITAAGAIFVGPYSPVSLGDYLAGSNHVLPTGGMARHSSGLGAYTFLRAQQIISYEPEGLAEVSSHIENFAIAEGLDAHAAAIRQRFV